jgi:hypothetical protein
MRRQGRDIVESARRLVTKPSAKLDIVELVVMWAAADDLVKVSGVGSGLLIRPQSEVNSKTSGPCTAGPEGQHTSLTSRQHVQKLEVY